MDGGRSPQGKHAPSGSGTPPGRPEESERAGNGRLDRDRNCLFCRIVQEELPAKVVYRDDRAVAFEDINPQAPVHLLVIPTRHVASLAELGEHDSEAGHLLSVINRLARERGLWGDRGARSPLGEHPPRGPGLSPGGPEESEHAGTSRRVGDRTGEGYRVVTNIGPHAGQSVPHLHWHLLGGRDMGWPPG